MASLDQPTQTVMMHRTEPTSLQNMALQLAEKLGGLVENNERIREVATKTNRVATTEEATGSRTRARTEQNRTGPEPHSSTLQTCTERSYIHHRDGNQTPVPQQSDPVQVLLAA
ncbi:UNVERIFIED_CONTAM: hypothetical protein FKN15_052783 [Acipenser sinensis]